MFAVCWGGARTWTGSGSRARTGARLFVLSRSRWMWARPGAGLGARLGPGGGSASSLAPSWWPPLWGTTGRPGAAPGTVAAPRTTLWAGVASGTGATLAVTVGKKEVHPVTIIQLRYIYHTFETITWHSLKRTGQGSYKDRRVQNLQICMSQKHGSVWCVGFNH